MRVGMLSASTTVIGLPDSFYKVEIVCHAACVRVTLTR